MSIERVVCMAEIAPLYADWPEMLAQSTLDGCMGRAWANAERTAAQIVNGDFALLAGDPAAEGALELARHVPEEHRTPWLLCCSAHDRWSDMLARAWGERATKLERYAIRKEPDVFDPARLQGLLGALPQGYRVVPIDDRLYEVARRSDWCRDFVSQFRDAADYARRGLGHAVLWGNEMVAGASSYAVYRQGIEIEVQTREEHRRKGLASACCAALILACLARGLYPSWDASNLHSVALAEKLGYHFDHAYTVYSAHVNQR